MKFFNKIPFLIILTSVLFLQLFSFQHSEAFVTSQLPKAALGNVDIVGNAGISSLLASPFTAAFDSSGNLWVVDQGNNRVLKYPPASQVTGGAATVAIGQPNLVSNTANNGGLSEYTLDNPVGLAFDSSGNLWVADNGNNRVLKYPPASQVTGGAATVAIGQPNFASGITNNGGISGGTLSSPVYITFDSSGNMWVADNGNNRVLKYSSAQQVIHGNATVAIGQPDFASGTANNGGLSASTLSSPIGIRFDPSGNLWVADANNNRVLKYPPASQVTGGAATVAIGQPNLVSNTANNGGLSASTLDKPVDITFDSLGNLWATDNVNNRVLKYSSAQQVIHGNATVAIGQPDFASGTANNGGLSASTLNGPTDLVFGPSGNLWVADATNNRVLKYPPASQTGGAATVAIGQPDFASNISNTGDISASTLNNPTYMTFGLSGILLVADTNNNRVLEYPPASQTGGIATIALGQPDLVSHLPNNGGISESTLSKPAGLAIDPSGNLWVADQANNRVLKYPPASQTGGAAIAVLGQINFASNIQNNGGRSSNTLSSPTGIAFDSSGNLWVADQANNRVLKYPPASQVTGGAATVAIGQPNFASGITGTTASTLNGPTGIAFDSSGNLWVADQANNRVLKYPPASQVTGGAVTVSLDQLQFPTDIALDISGNLWVADQANNRVLKYPPASQVTGGAATVAIGQPDLVSNTANPGGLSAGTLNTPFGTIFDSSGNLWVADQSNSRILEYQNLPDSTKVLIPAALITGSNNVTLNNFTTIFNTNNAFTETKLEVQQTNINPELSNPLGIIVGKYYHLETNAPDIISTRTISISYKSIDLTGVDPLSLKINRFSGGVWTPLATTINANTVKADSTTPGFSTFVLVGQAPITQSPATAVPLPTITSGGGSPTGGSCFNAFGAGQSLQVYDIKYDKCTTHQISITANSACDSMSIRIVDHHGASTFASLSPKQPFENKVLYTAPIDNNTNSFTMIAKNRQNSIITDVDSRQCTGSISRDYKMTSHGLMSTYQPQSSSSQTDFMQSIKNWINMTNPISDTQFLSHIGIPGTHIPSWMVKNAKLVTSGDISQQDLENALRYLASNGIIK